MPRPAKREKNVRIAVYLRPQVRDRTKEIAKDRYGIPVSRLVQQLLEREGRLKGGILYAKLAPR
jgi:hypothetical protein